MGVTSKLLALYRIDQQLSGLKSRLRAAEAYLRKQDRLLEELSARRAGLESQKKQLEASVHNAEVEASGPTMSGSRRFAIG
jgi:predicted  nucleic acid-binding Zn-ribbon protein